ncbi:MAG: YfhO family protein [Clostridia bacterium]|nr:YfhO family protein [Clostridia bacterium]
MEIKNKIRNIAAEVKKTVLRPSEPRERGYSVASFLLPAVLLLIAYFAMGLFPFGNNSVLSYDLNAQYVHFFAGLKNIFASGESPLYTWSRTLGGEYVGMIAYYLISPFNFIIMLLPLSMIETAVLLTILCKTGAIGFAAHLYFRRGMGVPTEKAIIFSTAYALCSYSVVYGSNLMWLDALFALPLLCWGIERLIKKEGHGLYVFALSYAMITNYYMGYMLCIVTAAYFFVYLFGEYAESREKTEGNGAVAIVARMGIYTVIALAISAIVILPAYHSLSFGKTDFTVPDFTPTQTADFLAVMKKMLIGSYDSVGNYGMAFIYTGIPTLIFAPAFFLSGKVGKREKTAYGILLCFLFSGFIISTVDLLWHGFQFPNGLNYRHAFIFSFFLCRLASRAYAHVETVSKKSIYAILVYAALAVFCIQAQHYSFGDDLTCIWLSLGALAVYATLYCFLTAAKKEKYLTAALTVCICLELTVASSMSLSSYDKDVIYDRHDSLESYIGKYKPIVDAVYNENTGFYRIERIGDRTVNDPLSLGLRGISGSTSTLNASVISLMDRIGYGGDSNFANYFSTSPVADSIFGIRYFISDDEIDNGLYVLNEELTAEAAEGVYVYENPYALSVAFSAKDTVILGDLSQYRSVFEANNALLSMLTGTEAQAYSVIKLKGVNYGSTYPANKDGHTFFVPSSPAFKGEYHSISFDVPTEAGKPLFVCLPSAYECEADLYINGEKAFEIDTTEGSCIRYLGVYNGETLNVQLRWSKTNLSLKSGISYFYQLDPAVLTEAYAKLSSGQVNITEHSNTRLFGSFTASATLPVLYTTVPYDGDWTVRIDGKTVDTVKANDALLAVDMQACGIADGEHTVELTYRSASHTAGTVITTVGILTLIALHTVNHGVLNKIPLFKKKQKTKNANE